MSTTEETEPDTPEPASTPSDGLQRTAPDVPANVRRMVLALVAVGAGLGALGTALSPYLLVEHPLVLIGLNPDSRHLVLVANRVELWEAVLVGSARRAMNFIATFGLGGIYGHMLVSWLEKKGPAITKVVHLVERIYARLGVWLVVFVPLYWVAALAGIARLRPLTFCLAIIPGQIAFVVGTLMFGEAIEEWTAPLIAFLSRNVVTSTLVCITIVILQRFWSRWRKRNKSPDEPDLPI